MRHLQIVVSASLNVLFCLALLWFFTHYSYLRPYAGSTMKEIIAALLLLFSLYTNYYLLYPKLHKNHPVLYWSSVFVISVVTAGVDLAVAYPGMMQCNGFIIKELGEFRYFSIHLLFMFGRNFAFNFFPFMLRERRHLQEALDTEVRIVYRDARMVDVADNQNHDMHLISKDDIYYCKQDGNYTRIYVTQGDCWYTRPGSMKYLEQLLGKDEFVRISPSFLLPYQYIKACNGSEVFMKRMSWMKSPLVFKIETKISDQVTEQITLHLLAAKGLKNVKKSSSQLRKKRKPILPSQDKIDEVFKYIKEHPECRSTEISAQTNFSSSTIERSIAELRKHGLVDYIGSKRNGGYIANEVGVKTPVSNSKKTTTVEEPKQEKEPVQKKVNEEIPETENPEQELS